MKVHIDVLIEDDDMEDDGNPTGEGSVCILRPCRVDSKESIHMNNLIVGLRRDGSYLRS